MICRGCCNRLKSTLVSSIQNINKLGGKNVFPLELKEFSHLLPGMINDVEIEGFLEMTAEVTSC